MNCVAMSHMLTIIVQVSLPLTISIVHHLTGVLQMHAVLVDVAMFGLLMGCGSLLIQFGNIQHFLKAQINRCVAV